MAGTDTGLWWHCGVPRHAHPFTRFSMGSPIQVGASPAGARWCAGYPRRNVHTTPRLAPVLMVQGVPDRGEAKRKRRPDTPQGQSLLVPNGFLPLCFATPWEHLEDADRRHSDETIDFAAPGSIAEECEGVSFYVPELFRSSCTVRASPACSPARSLDKCGSEIFRDSAISEASSGGILPLV